jgi:hypothetical protein
VFFGEVRVTHVFSFLCCVFCFDCLYPVSCVPNVSSFSELFILDCPIRFPLTFIYTCAWPFTLDLVTNDDRFIKKWWMEFCQFYGPKPTFLVECCRHVNIFYMWGLMYILISIIYCGESTTSEMLYTYNVISLEGFIFHM